jgi:hypothetical protein
MQVEYSINPNTNRIQFFCPLHEVKQVVDKFRECGYPCSVITRRADGSMIRRASFQNYDLAVAIINFSPSASDRLMENGYERAKKAQWVLMHLDFKGQLQQLEERTNKQRVFSSKEERDAYVASMTQQPTPPTEIPEIPEIPALPQRTLTYRELQAKAKAMGIPAKGTYAELECAVLRVEVAAV